MLIYGYGCRTGDSRGFAFVRYKYEDEAQKAVDRLDGAPELLTSGNRCLPSAGCDWIVVHFVRVLFAGRVVDGREIMVMISHLLFLTGVGWIH